MYSEEQRQQIFDDICELIISGKSLRFALNEVSILIVTVMTHE